MLYSTISLSTLDVIKEEPTKLFSPKNPTPMETIFLSNIDQAVAFPVETVFFYEVPQNRGPSSTLGVIEMVKRAVCEVLLVPYYFMAGRLNFNNKTNRFELLCNNGGVNFVGANSRLELKELGDLSLPNETFHYLVPRVALYNSLAETPICSIQVTRFKCGGFSIGFVTNHAILDGKSASEMFHNLASICRGEGLNIEVINNERTCLKSRTPPQIKYPHKEYITPPKNTPLATCFTSQDQKSPSPLVFVPNYVHKVFSFTPQMLNSLKEKAIVKCTSFEAIVAHLWRARTRAIFDDLDEFSTVLFAVDIRAKMSPPLPNGFVGNAVVTAFSSAKVKDLMEKPFRFCVEKVKEGRDRVTEDYVKSVIDWLEVYKGVPSTCNGKNFYVSAWWKLNFGDLDFGYGKTVFGGPVVSGNDEFVVLLNNRKIGGGINVLIGLEKDKMKRFMDCVFEI